MKFQVPLRRYLIALHFNFPCDTYIKIELNFPGQRRVTQLFYIYKDECLSVCLFVCLSVCLFAMHLDTVRASAVKLSRDPPLIQEKVVGYFFPENYKSFPPPPDPLGFQPMKLQYSVFKLRTSHYRFSRTVSPNLRSIRLQSYWLTQNQ